MGKYVQTRDITLNSFSNNFAPFLLIIFLKFYFFNTRNTTVDIYLELIVCLHYQANMFKKAATAECCHQHAVLLFLLSEDQTTT